MNYSMCPVEFLANVQVVREGYPEHVKPTWTGVSTTTSRGSRVTTPLPKWCHPCTILALATAISQTHHNSP